MTYDRLEFHLMAQEYWTAAGNPSSPTITITPIVPQYFIPSLLDEGGRLSLRQEGNRLTTMKITLTLVMVGLLIVSYSRTAKADSIWSNGVALISTNCNSSPDMCNGPAGNTGWTVY